MAIEDITGFTIKPSQFNLPSLPSNCQFSGIVMSYDKIKKIIRLKINEGLSGMLEYHWERAEYDIEFSSNRLTFKLQHHALKWMKEHDLFDVLINNPIYNEYPSQNNEQKERTNVHIATLNFEQNLAVNSIIGAHDNIPFLLYGPPGTSEFKSGHICHFIFINSIHLKFELDSVLKVIEKMCNSKRKNCRLPSKYVKMIDPGSIAF